MNLDFLKNLFKKRIPKNPEKTLKQALEEGLITPEEFLRLVRDRAIEDYENFCKEQKIRSKR